MTLLTFMISIAIDLVQASMKKTLLELAVSTHVFDSLPKSLQYSKPTSFGVCSDFFSGTNPDSMSGSSSRRIVMIILGKSTLTRQ